MNHTHTVIENADILVLRNRKADLQEARDRTNEDIQAGDTAQQHDGRIQQQRLSHQIQAVEDQIEEMNTLLSEGSATQDGTISIGDVVTIRIDATQAKTYILVNEHGGQKLSGKTMLSSQTPVGQALIGRRARDVFPIEVGEDQITVEIVKIEALA